jgi:hypothetical protein
MSEATTLCAEPHGRESEFNDTNQMELKKLYGRWKIDNLFNNKLMVSGFTRSMAMAPFYPVATARELNR